MNRRQLFGWLSALPFVPAALAGSAAPILKWIPAHTNTGAAFPEVWGGGYARVTVSTSLANWAGYSSIDMKYRPNLPEWF